MQPASSHTCTGPLPWESVLKRERERNGPPQWRALKVSDVSVSGPGATSVVWILVVVANNHAAVAAAAVADTGLCPARAIDVQNGFGCAPCGRVQAQSVSGKVVLLSFRVEDGGSGSGGGGGSGGGTFAPLATPQSKG